VRQPAGVFQALLCTCKNGEWPHCLARSIASPGTHTEVRHLGGWRGDAIQVVGLNFIVDQSGTAGGTFSTPTKIVLRRLA
jgi:hypothetical protein